MLRWWVEGIGFSQGERGGDEGEGADGPGEEPAGASEESGVAAEEEGGFEPSVLEHGELGDAIAVRVDELGEAGGGADEHPAVIFQGAVAEDFGVLEVLASRPTGGIHAGHGERLGTGGGHAADALGEIAIKADGGLSLIHI